MWKSFLPPCTDPISQVMAADSQWHESAIPCVLRWNSGKCPQTRFTFGWKDLLEIPLHRQVVALMPQLDLPNEQIPKRRWFPLGEFNCACQCPLALTPLGRRATFCVVEEPPFLQLSDRTVDTMASDFRASSDSDESISLMLSPHSAQPVAYFACCGQI